MVQDTAWKGYEKIPLWIMQGIFYYYEIIEELEKKFKKNQHMYSYK